MDEKVLPKLSLARGLDYGGIDRTPSAETLYVKPTVVEQVATSWARPYGLTFQSSFKNIADRQRFSLGTSMITFAFGGAETVDDIVNRTNGLITLPHPAEVVAQFYRINFIGSATFAQTRNGLLGVLQHGTMRGQVAKNLLYLYEKQSAR